MLLYGGVREDVEPLLKALASHWYRVRSFNRGTCLAEVDSRARAYSIGGAVEWYNELSAEWAKRKRTKDPAVEAKPNTVTEMVRTDIRKSPAQALRSS